MIHFGDDLDKEILARAQDETRRADMLIALGTCVLLLTVDACITRPAH